MPFFINKGSESSKHIHVKTQPYVLKIKTQMGEPKYLPKMTHVQVRNAYRLYVTVKV
jgi:hypothetical protein